MLTKLAISYVDGHYELVGEHTRDFTTLKQRMCSWSGDCDRRPVASFEWRINHQINLTSTLYEKIDGSRSLRQLSCVGEKYLKTIPGLANQYTDSSLDQQSAIIPQMYLYVAKMLESERSTGE